MLTFLDYYQNEVKLSFLDHPFSASPKHVWVICSYQNKWLLTKHKERGYEFPGGKVEPGETPEEAAIREVKEETGGLVDNLCNILRMLLQWSLFYLQNQVQKYHVSVDESGSVEIESEPPLYQIAFCQRTLYGVVVHHNPFGTYQPL